MSFRLVSLWLIAVFSLFFLTLIQAEPPAEIRLQIGMHIVQAEVADTEEARAHGLMQRAKLGKNQGMLFVFDNAGIQAMWMRNTPLALSVAFIDKNGLILNIAEMEPLSEIPHASAGAARYALEMNAGWFAGRGIKGGAQVKGLPQ